MSILEAFILGLLQGLTEFLPISSSGHLVLAEKILEVKKAGIAFEVFVHFGTLLAIIVAFAADVKNLLLAFGKGIKSLFNFSLRETYRRFAPPHRGGVAVATVVDRSDPYLKLLLLILLASIPAALAGILLGDLITLAFNKPSLAAIFLIVTGFILWGTRFATHSTKDFRSKEAIWVGISQAVAILPGISRSGITISTGLFVGIPRWEAVRFSFLLAIPAILGATILKIKELIVSPPAAAEFLYLIVGTITAFIFGYIAIRFLLNVVRKGKLDRFAYYCWAVGVLSLLAFEFLQ